MESIANSFLEIFGTNAGAKVCITVLCAVFVSLLGENWIAYVSVIVLVTIDSITGVAAAWKNGEVNSSDFFKGSSKILVFIAVLIGFHQLIRVIPELGFLDGYAALWLASNEMISITENAVKMGVPVPPFIKKALLVYRDKLDKRKRG